MRCAILLIASLFALLSVSAVTLAQDAAAGTPTAVDGNAFEIGPEAGDDPTTIEQGYFVYELAAGEAATGRVLLRNPSMAPVTIELAEVDAETAQGGGSAFAAAEATPVAAGSWVRLADSRVTLASGDQTSVEFTVQPPAGVAPGQYLAGIAAFVPTARGGTATTGADQAGASITMQTRYVIGVQVDVPGEWTPSLAITGASALEQPSGTKLGIAIRNNGDTFLKPNGSMTLSNAAATPILTQPIELGTFVTGTDVTYPIAWPGVPVGGEYGVVVELNYSDDKVARYSGMLTVSGNAPVAPPAPDAETQPLAQPAPELAPSVIQPWMLVVFGGLLLLMVILLTAMLLRGRRSS